MPYQPNDFREFFDELFALGNPKTFPCPECSGGGTVIDEWEPAPGHVITSVENCPACGGKGWVPYDSGAIGY